MHVALAGCIDAGVLPQPRRVRSSLQHRLQCYHCFLRRGLAQTAPAAPSGSCTHTADTRKSATVVLSMISARFCRLCCSTQCSTAGSTEAYQGCWRGLTGSECAASMDVRKLACKACGRTSRSMWDGLCAALPVFILDMCQQMRVGAYDTHAGQLYLLSRQTALTSGGRDESFHRQVKQLVAKALPTEMCSLSVGRSRVSGDLLGHPAAQVRFAQLHTVNSIAFLVLQTHQILVGHLQYQGDVR